MDPDGGCGSLTVAKKKARPPGPGRLVRIKPDVFMQAQFVARARGIGIGDYLAEICRSTVARDYVKEQKRLEEEGRF